MTRRISWPVIPHYPKLVYTMAPIQELVAPQEWVMGSGAVGGVWLCVAVCVCAWGCMCVGACVCFHGSVL